MTQERRPQPGRRTRVKRDGIRPMTPGIGRAARIRAHLAALVLGAGLFGLAWRAWALQVDESDRYRTLAARQHALTVEIPAPRGEILDARDRPLAVSADTDSVWANPREIRDVAATAEQLATILGLGADRALEIEAKLAADRRFVWIERRVRPEVAARVREAKLAGIEIAREPRRWYPSGALAGPVIGRADIDGIGVEGLELALNDHLTGTRGAGRAVRDARGRRMFADGLSLPEPGHAVRLTLDRSVQAIAEAALADAVTTHAAKTGVVVVLDVATSRVLALASSPTHDPNHITGQAARNRAVADAFEAGSVMKVFTMAAALDAGVVKPDTELDLGWGEMRVGSKTIRDTYHDRSLDATGIIKRSSNVGTVKIALMLGRDRLHAAFSRFGFGAKTGIELPGEQRGMMRPGRTWREIELATISYGYGLTVTPVQVAAALAAIGNDGEYRAPRIVDAVIDRDGQVIAAPTPEPSRAISARAARELRRMMVSVFEGGKQAGTAHSIVVPGFVCGGKTGTARKWDPKLKEYATNRHLSSFAGLAPIDGPRLAIVVFVDEPSGGDYYGGKVAGPVFARVASEALRYLGVPGRSLACPPAERGAPPDPAPKTCLR
jgi:cell division protein FtsI (penicillin-binding protein 3)